MFVFFSALIISLLFNAILFIPFGIRILILFVALPFGLLATFALVENFTDFKRFFVLVGFGLSTLFGSYLRFFLVGFLMLAITNTGFFAIIYRLILWNSPIQSDYIQIFTNIIYGFLMIMNIAFILALVTISSSLSYFSMKEIYSADHLKSIIQTFGVSNSIRGYERE